MAVWLLWAALLSLTASQPPLETSYTPGKEYEYDYETQIVTGVPGGSKIYSGLKLKAKLKFQLQSASDVMAQLERIRFLKINDPIESADPTKETIPDDAFRTMTEPEADKMKADLHKPIKFKYHNGQVTDFVTESDDPEYSVNMKRGLLSVFQLNLDGRKSTQPHRSDPQTPGPYNQYMVMETSVSGECETLYKVTTSPYPRGMPAFKISKVRNYEKCLERPQLTRSMFSGMKCAQCERDKSEPLKASTEIRYYMRGTANQFLIQSAIGESRYFFTMYSDQGGNAASFINQTLYLTDTRSIQQPISLSTSPKQHSRGLKATVPRQPESTSPQSPSSPSSPRKQTLTPEERMRIKTKIIKQLDALAVFSSPDVKEEAGPTLIELAKEMRKADSSVLEDVYKVIKSKSAPKMALLRKAYYDLLPALGTYDSVEMLAKLIETREMGHSEAATSFNMVAVSAQPEVAIAKKILELLKRKDVLDNRELKRSAFLALGAIGNRINVDAKKKVKDITRKQELLQKLSRNSQQQKSVQELQTKLQKLKQIKTQIESELVTLKQDIIKEILNLLKSPESDDRMMALKTAGNAGFKEHIPHIRSIIENKNKPLLERVQAIFSLRKLANEEPKIVLDILLPRYFDRSDREEIRISSYLVSAGASPSRPVLEMIAEYLRTEPNPHVGTFVFTHLEQLSNSTHPCLMSWAKNATYALKFSRKFSPSYHYSRFIHLPYYDDYTKIGGALELGFITSPDEFIPRAGAAHLNLHILGSSYNIGEIGFNTEGLQKIASKILGPDGVLAHGKSLVDLLKERHPRSTSPKINPVEDAHRRLNVSPRNTPDPEGHIYFKLFGNELRYYQIDRKTVTDLIMKDAIKTGTVEEELSAGKPMSAQSTMMLADSIHVVMTEAGLPLRLRLDGVVMTKIHGKMTLTGAPSLFKSRRPQQNVGEMEMKFDITPSAVLNVRGEMEMDGKYFKTGAAINFMLQTDTPLSFDIGTDIRKRKLFTKVNMEKMRERLLKMESLPYTFIRRDPLNITEYPTLPDKKDIEVADGAMKFPVSKDFGTNELGYTFSLRGEHVVRNFLQGVPYCPLSGKQQYYMTLSPGYKPQKYAELQLQLLYSIEKKPRSSSPSVSSSPPSSSQPSESSGVLSWLSSLLGSEDDSAPQSANSPKQNQKGPVSDLRTSDSSISKLEKELKQSQQDDSLLDDRKSGFALNLMTVNDNRTSDRKAQMSVLFESTMDKAADKLHFSFYRTPIPGKETDPWKMTAKMDLTYPKMTTDPSDLLKSSYQEKIHRLIKKYTKQDALDQLSVHLKEQLPLKQSKLASKIQSSANTRSIVNEVLRTVLEQAPKSADPEVLKVKKIVIEQKRLEKEVKNILRESKHPSHVNDLKEKIKQLIDSTKTKASQVKHQLTTPSSVDESTRQILLKKAVLQQQDMHSILHDVVRRLRTSITPSERRRIDQKISLNVRSLKDLISSQTDLKRAPVSEIVTVVKTQSPEQEQLARKLSQLQQKQDEHLRDISSRKGVDSVLSVDETKVRSVLNKLREVEQEIEGLPVSSKIIHDAVLKQLLDASLQQEQITKELRRIQKDSPIFTQSEKIKAKTLSSLVKEIKQKSNSISKILAQVTHHKQELRVLSKTISKEEKTLLLRLQKVELLQVISLRKLSSSNKVSISKTSSKQDRKTEIQNSMRKAEKAGQLLEQTLLLLKNQDQTPELLIKAIKVSQTQADLMDKLEKAAREVRIRLVAESSRNDPELDKIEKQAAVRKLELISAIQQHLSVTKSRRSILNIDEIETLKEVHRDLDEIRRDQRKVQADVRQIAELKNVKKAPQKVSKAILKLKDVRNQINKLQRQMQNSRLHEKIKDVIEDLKDATRVQRRIIKSLNDTLKVVKDRGSRLSLAQMLKAQSKSIDRIEKQTEQLENGIDTSQSSNISKTSRRRWSAKSNNIRSNSSGQQDPTSSQSSSKSKQSSKQQPPDSSKARVQSDTNKKSQRARQTLSTKLAVGSSSSQGQDDQIKATLEIEFGSVGEHPKSILIQMVGKKSLEQLLWESDQISPISRSEVTKRYLDDEEEGEEEIKGSYKRLRNEVNLFRHIHFNVKYPMDEMPQYLREMSKHLKEFMKYSLYEHLISSLPDPVYRKDKAEFIIVYKMNDRQVDMMLKTYDETDQFRGVTIPYYAKMYLEGLRTRQSKSSNRLQGALEKVTKNLPGTCEVKKSLIKSLDGKEYRLPETGSCDVILSMDCSSTKAFVVKARKNAHLLDKRDVEISAEGRIVKVIPESQSVRVQVDGQTEDVQLNKPLVVRESQPQGSHKHVLLEVVRVKTNKIRVIVPRKGLQVESDGIKVDVKVSPFHYSRVCGVCGNYDGKTDNEYETPERDIHSDPKCFVLSYVMSNPRCNADSLKSQCRHLPQSSGTGPCSLKQETIKRDRTNSSQPEVCYSVEPVKKCDPGCKPRDSRPKSVQMHCLSKTDPQVPRLERDRQSRVLSELQGQSVDYSVRVQEPRRCRDL